ncbi:MAG: hypothetical protein M3Z04_12430 [Chloroflexota bacterium]|nr:hypothetical protein [Chloroflexota bacterium]
MPSPRVLRSGYRLCTLALLLLTSACLTTTEAPPSPISASVTPPAATVTALPTRLPPTQAPTQISTRPATDTPPATATTAATQSPAPTAQPPSPTPATDSSLLRAALAVMGDVSSYHYTATMQTYDLGRPVQTAAEGDYHAPGDLRWVTSAGGITTTAIVSGNLYTVAVSNETWTTLPGAVGERAHQLAWQSIAQAQNVTEVNRDPITTIEPTVHLSFTLPLNALPLDARPWKLAEGDVWLGLTDRRVYAFKLHALEPNTEVTLRMYLSAFDQPVQITLPSAGPALGARNGRLLYIRHTTGSGSGTLRIRDLATGGDTAVPDSAGNIESAAWSPDGATVLYSAAGTLFQRTADGRVLNLGRGSAPAWSPDGTTIAFLHGRAPAAVWLSDPLLNAPQRLGVYVAQQLTYAPDGSALVISGWSPALDANTELPYLFHLDVASGAVQPLERGAGGATWPRFAPDGSRLALVVGGHLTLADPDGSAPTPLEASGSDSAPVWNPDGSALVYAHRAGPSTPTTLWLRPVDGGPAQTLPDSADSIPCDWQ